MRKGKDRRKAWKRRILPGCPPLALGTADVPSLVPASRGRARSAQPGHPQPRQLGYRDAPQAQSPHISPWSGQGGSGRPSAGRGLWLSPSFRPALDPPDRPSPSPTQRGWGRGGGGRQDWGSPLLAGAASWGPPASSGVWSRRAACAELPGRGYFQPGLGRAPRGPGSHQCAAFSLVRRVPAAGSPDPRFHFHGNPLRPWEMLPGLSFPPRKQGGREGEETSGSPLPNQGHRHDAKAMGAAGGASGSANVPAAQLPAPAGLCCGVPPAPWGSLPFLGGAGTQPQRCCPPAGSLGKTAGCAGEPRHERGKDLPQPLAVAPACPAPPNCSHLCAGGQLGGG